MEGWEWWHIREATISGGLLFFLFREEVKRPKTRAQNQTEIFYRVLRLLKVPTSSVFKFEPLCCSFTKQSYSSHTPDTHNELP